MRLMPTTLLALCCLLADGARAATPLSADEALHVLNRMGYGPRPGEIGALRASGLASHLDSQLDPATPGLTGAAARRVHALSLARADARPGEADALARQERLLRAIASGRQLEEVLLAFWLAQLPPASPASLAAIAEQARPHLFGPYRDLRAALPGLSAGVSPRSLCRSLAVFFVSERPPASLVKRMEAAWRRSGGEQRAVLRSLFTSADFLAPDYRGGKRKDPFRLLVSALRAGGLEVANAAPLADAQVALEAGEPRAWERTAFALAQGGLPLAAEAPSRARQSSAAPPLRATPGAPSQPGALASPVSAVHEAPTPSAVAMAAATPTPPLQAARLRAALGMDPGAGAAPETAVDVLLDDAFRYR
ncbi:hypothetical protein B0920_17900 [Massilia sp. KIM]|uniref:DUF1800 family protein n=1 Tax=Massilia sp. KIM TaxID=1955422 RepID=UPI00098F0F22|nr:DUF1800 family protein [Massilia sp. KIM]OON60827.1 hypothetical protein B0920_17900 [Massilia sp. KIM]